MSRLLCLLCFATVCIWEGIAQNQNNVDVLEPVVRISPDRTARAPTLEGVNDYFGWSAIFHATQPRDEADTIEQSLSKLRLIVGAPWGTFSGGLGLFDPDLPRQTRTGLVYSCPITPGPCEGVRGDVSSYINVTADLANQVGDYSTTTYVPPDAFCEGRLFDQAPNAKADFLGLPNSIPIQYDNKEGQLLGSVLYSTGDIFIACAPRWQFSYNTGGQNFARGVCYHGDRDLTGFTAISPCVGNLNSMTNALNVTHDSFCLGGTAVVVNDNNFVVSAPGHSANRGLLTSVLTAGVQSSTVFRLGRPTGSIGITDQYQGFQVINAYIISERGDGVSPPPNLVASVPRAGVNYNGQLIVYQGPTTLTNPIVTPATGTQMAEFFGYSLAAGRLDDDGYDEVLVGAPMYSGYGTNGAIASVERGRVYIFRNTGGQLSGDALVVESPLSLVGGARARFGNAVAFLGDIDNDGYNDFAVGAPYYMNEGESDTGAVFIYYGRANMTETVTQTPFMISATTLRSNVVVGSELLTFGWSLFSGYDVDNNGYNDLIVGAYESQAVFVLRSLPVADIFVTALPHSEVNVDTDTSFQLIIRARFNGTGVDFPLSVDFEVREQVVGGSRRAYFDTQSSASTVGKGTLLFTALNIDVSTPVTIYPDDTSDFRMLRFDISLVAIERIVSSPVSGNQAVTSLSRYPSLRHNGDTMAEVPLLDVCNNDGCNTDVMFSDPTLATFLVVANQRMARSFMDVSVRNSDSAGIEPASNIELVISGLPDFVSSVAGVSNIACGSIVNNTVTCPYGVTRLNNGQTTNAMIEFSYITTSLIGNEVPEMSDLLLVIADDNGLDMDNNLLNNGRTVTFEPTARANLAVTIEFSPLMGTYRAGEPSVDDITNNGVNVLGDEIALIVNVSNSGPSIIRNGNLTLFLPTSNAATGSLFYLYPYEIRIPSNSRISCSQTNLDPNQFVRAAPAGRKRRSAMTLTELRAARAAKAVPVHVGRAGKITRMKRQTTFDLDCTREMCTMFSCSITDFPDNNGVSFTLRTRVDNRFFSTQISETPRIFNLRASATVSNNDDFYTGVRNDTSQSAVMLSPFMAPDDQGDLLIHVILWPVLGGLLLLVLLIIVLYFCGFFRRKTKPDGENETEGGDFDPPMEGTKGSYNPQQKEAAMATKPDEEVSKL